MSPRDTVAERMLVRLPRLPGPRERLRIPLRVDAYMEPRAIDVAQANAAARLLLGDDDAVIASGW